MLLKDKKTPTPPALFCILLSYSGTVGQSNTCQLSNKKFSVVVLYTFCGTHGSDPQQVMWLIPLFCLFSPPPPASLNYANALDVWSRLRHSVLLVVLLRYWVPLQWMHTTVHSTKSLPKGWKEFKALKRQKGLSWDFFMYTEKKNKI